MPVKSDPIINEQLQAMNLTIWSMMHPKQPFFNEKTGKQSQREDKTRVIVTLNGPGVSHPAMGFGATLREAVDDALMTGRDQPLLDRVPGLKGALLRLDAAMSALRFVMMQDRYSYERFGFSHTTAFGELTAEQLKDLDDDVPF